MAVRTAAVAQGIEEEAAPHVGPNPCMSLSGGHDVQALSARQLRPAGLVKIEFEAHSRPAVLRSGSW